MTVLEEEAPANYVPAAAVKRRGRALSGITGRKELVGGLVSQV
ncbi:membrane protein [Carboxydothermus islandicus]|uniref:Membrane protein n=1 Tax=Carboxydothermus islandicus TaxID=661089 RepID=A0A1L8D341_9THEO|nr:membrane protein [Carboxydothermus islandicus]